MTTVAGYTLVDERGVWFLLDGDRNIVSTLIDMGSGTWRARTPGGDAVTVDVPADVEEPAVYVAERITRQDETTTTGEPT